MNVSDACGLLFALDLTPHFVALHKCLQFKTVSSSHVTRIILVRLGDESGNAWYILGRDAAGSRIHVAPRDSED